MDATMHLIARSVQLAVMTAPSVSLSDAAAAARRQRRSLLTILRGVLAPAVSSPRPMAG